ncbi:hypothetical protein VTI74DRAFT_6121 [Chaetomium olivicolor]
MPRRVFFFRLLSRHVHDDDEAAAEETAEINEKRVRTPRDWSAVFLTTLRFLQFIYFAFAYYSLYHFQKSGYFRDDGPWHHSPDQSRHSRRMMRWVRMQASMTLIYHALVLIVPSLLLLVRASRRPLTSLATVFGDGCAMMATLSMMVLLDTYHEGYCHSPPPKGAFDIHSMFSFASHGRQHDMSRHRSVCRSLDVVAGLAGVVILSYFVSAIVTTWRVKRSSPTVCAKVEQSGDVEQGIAQRPAVDDARSLQALAPTPQRQHSPPPPYHPVFHEQAHGHTNYVGDVEELDPIPRGRPSVETTTSSIGLENYLVSDGWRAPEDPPEYSSRPPSLHHALA